MGEEQVVRRSVLVIRLNGLLPLARLSGEETALLADCRYHGVQEVGRAAEKATGLSHPRLNHLAAGDEVIEGAGSLVGAADPAGKVRRLTSEDVRVSWILLQVIEA